MWDCPCCGAEEASRYGPPWARWGSPWAARYAPPWAAGAPWWAARPGRRSRKATLVEMKQRLEEELAGPERHQTSRGENCYDHTQREDGQGGR
jgi:hypothetical protein